MYSLFVLIGFIFVHGHQSEPFPALAETSAAVNAAVEVSPDGKTTWRGNMREETLRRGITDTPSASLVEMSTDTNDAVSTTDETAAKSDEIAAKSDDTTVKSDATTAKSDATAATSGATAAASDEIAAKSDDIAANSGEAAAKSDDTATKSDETATKAAENPVTAGGATAESDETTASETPVNTDATAAKSDETAAPTNSDTTTAEDISLVEEKGEVVANPEVESSKRYAKWIAKFQASNPLAKESMLRTISIALISLFTVLVIVSSIYLACRTQDDVKDLEDRIALAKETGDANVELLEESLRKLNEKIAAGEDPNVQLEENKFPTESVFGEAGMTLIWEAHDAATTGFNTKNVCSVASSLLILAAVYAGDVIILFVAMNNINNMPGDMAERDDIFQKFRDPETWFDKDWAKEPETPWRRENMLWFCNQVIYGKVEHLAQLNPMWDLFIWLVIILWIALGLGELRETYRMQVCVHNLPIVDGKEIMKGDQVQGATYPLKALIFTLVIIPKYVLNIWIMTVGLIFIMYNDLENDLQDVLLKTIEMAFILEMDELLFSAFVSIEKQQRLERAEFPELELRGLGKVINFAGEYLRLAMVLAAGSCAFFSFNSHAYHLSLLTPRQAGVAEGCCNFVEYLKGVGQAKLELLPAHPCSEWRGQYIS